MPIEVEEMSKEQLEQLEELSNGFDPEHDNVKKEG